MQDVRISVGHSGHEPMQVFFADLYKMLGFTLEIPPLPKDYREMNDWAWRIYRYDTALNYSLFAKPDTGERGQVKVRFVPKDTGCQLFETSDPHYAVEMTYAAEGRPWRVHMRLRGEHGAYMQRVYERLLKIPA